MAVLAVGCSAEAGRDDPSWRLRYGLTGGSAGFDVTFEVDSSGLARYERRHPEPRRRSLGLEAAELAAIRRVVEQSGFLELGQSYRDPEAASDAFLYVIEWDTPEVTKRVEASDGVVLPEALTQVRDLIGLLQRRAIQDGDPGDTDGGE